MGLKVYFDGSGKNDTNVLTVGGYFCWDEACAVIEDEWNTALMEEGICNPDGSPGVFHLADFGNPHCKYGTNKWDIQTKRIPFLKKLAGIVNRKDSHIVSFSIENTPYRQFLKETPNPQVYGPEHFSGCALMAFVFVEVKIEMAGFAKEPVAYIFEKGDRQHEINHAFMEYDAGHPEFENRSLDFGPKKLPLLQAADFTCGKIQEILERAHSALGFLDSGMHVTPVERFERYYSFDGTTKMLMKPVALHDCYVANKAHFVEADRRMFGIIRNNPALIERRLTRKLWIPNESGEAGA